MSTYQVSVSRNIAAPASHIYALLADYHNGHPHILPKAYFGDLVVEQGGMGAGTLVNFQMRVMGRMQTFRAVIAEPQPGRVLMETNLPDGPVSTFTLDPLGDGQQTRVTIATEGKTQNSAIGGWIERFFTQLFLRRVYVAELALIAKQVEQ
jgi:hypothetical protein